MKLYPSRDKQRVGIYIIRNKINNKLYIGKSINIYLRLKQHNTHLNTKNKDENPHLINAWHKYGKDNFEYFVIEDCEKDDILLKEKELYWMNRLESTNRNFGYNLRMDTSTKCIWAEESKLKMAETMRNKYIDNPEIRTKISIEKKEFWKNNPEIKAQMAENVSKSKKKYNFEQYTKDNILIKIWEDIDEIISENPTYKWQNIYSVCNGYKPTIYGYKWKKVKR